MRDQFSKEPHVDKYRLLTYLSDLINISETQMLRTDAEGAMYRQYWEGIGQAMVSLKKDIKNGYFDKSQPNLNVQD